MFGLKIGLEQSLTACDLNDCFGEKKEEQGSSRIKMGGVMLKLNCFFFGML
jgi:hypothetical protein